MLELRELSKAWPDFRLELELAIGEGEIAALLGPSGSGKSTLLRIIAGLEAPDSGRVLVAGRDVTRLAPERRGIGMVFQDYALFPHLNVRGNIEYGPRMRGADRKERRELAAATARSFEIERLLGRSPRALSGGEMQRVALARAMAAGPSILLLDEPLSSLDSSLRLRLRGEIAKRLREAGMTALLVTHDSREALALADRVFLMRSGSIDSSGAPERLYESPPTAWSASFLGRGPVLEILSMRESGGATLAETAIGCFACSIPPEGPSGGATARSLFFPAEAPRLEASPPEIDIGVARNSFVGRVVASSFEGERRRIALACPIRPAPGRAGRAEIALELALPSGCRPAIGEELLFTVSADRCAALPGSIAATPSG